MMLDGLERRERQMANLTLHQASGAIRVYNNGYYRGQPNCQLDQCGYDLFADGLGSGEAEIRKQLEFTGSDYGGTALSLAKQVLPEKIASKLYAERNQYAEILRQTEPLLIGDGPRIDQISRLYEPFKESVVAGARVYKNWLVWASKFWHFLRPDVFPIKDRLVVQFLGAPARLDKVQEYLDFAARFKRFATARGEWLPELRSTDAFYHGDVKLWDKVLFQSALASAVSPDARFADRPQPEKQGCVEEIRHTIEAVVRKVGQYANGQDILEIHIPKSNEPQLPPLNLGETSICLVRKGQTWHSTIRKTLRNRYIWISPRLRDSAGEPMRLADAIGPAKPNQRVWLVRRRYSLEFCLDADELKSAEIRS